MELYIGAVSSEPPTRVHAHAEARTWAETDAEATGLYRAQDDCLSMDVFTSRVTVCVWILLLLFILLLLLLRGLALRYQARVTVCVCDLKYSTFVCPGVQQARADAAGSGTPPDQYLSPSTIRCRC